MADKKVRLSICIPCLDTWDAQFGMCMVNLAMALAATKAPGLTIERYSVRMERSSLIHKSRRNLLQQSKDAGFTHVLFIDSDQTFPSVTAHLMLLRNLPIVAANVPVKSLPSQPTARKFNPAWHGGDVVYTDHDSTGVEQVWRIGCGIMLIDLAVLDKIAKPWFAMRSDETVANEDVGEDWFFCKRLEDAGIPIYIDHDVSQGVGHRGVLEFTHAHVGVLKESEDDQEQAA